ncbi:hypothetical protein Scep_022243 [Stephania cephalantha]|uniref:Ribosomal RNA-processing protein 7 C-terminal domain-containing protein n=1 Tax=Stephania cephalantha TaxID=152367 RepID=A0AAP0FGS1_9MAGN
MDKKKLKREGKRSNKEGTKLRKRKLLENENSTEQVEGDQFQLNDEVVTTDGKKTKARPEKKMNGFSMVKKRKQKKGGGNDFAKVDHIGLESKGGFEKQKCVEMVLESNQSENQSIIKNDAKAQKTDIGSEIVTKKPRKSREKRNKLLLIKEKSRKSSKKKDHQLTINSVKSVEGRTESTDHAVYDMTSEDEDCSKGMKKWIVEYHQSRPGVKVMLDSIDEFVTAHEAQLEEDSEKIRNADDGWVVVEHQKGRKKTTDSKSGITVGSVAQAALLELANKKKHKDVELGFYRNQRKEAQRNEIMMLQNKFELDKKRIQQLRAARKFKPY